MTRRIVWVFLVASALAWTAVFAPGAANREGLARLVVDYPAEGTIFPPDLAAPTVLWHDSSSAAAWRVEVAFADGGTVTAEAAGGPPPRGAIDERAVSPTNELYEPTPYQASAQAWKPEGALWEEIKRRSRESPAVLTIRGVGPGGGRALSEGSATITTSRDPVGAPIFYRDVPLMPSQGKDGVIKPLDQESLPLIAWRLKDVAREDNKLLLTGMPTCANCHSFPRDGSTLAMDLDGPDGDKGAYALAPIGKERTVIGSEQVMTWNAFPGRGPAHFTLGFLARISPDGKKVLATVNEALYVRNYAEWKILQTFYATRGILAWYDRGTKEIRALPGADDPAWVHCGPDWSPDGKTIVFARAEARDPYDRTKPVATYAGDPNETEIRYDIYRMPFADGKGGTPVPIEGASANGLSNSFPRITPDGKWIVFVKAKNGQLLRPDGKLWIVPIEGGKAREMRCNGAPMNSWHAFSPNGRWMVFSSKRNTPYTQMFLTHIDENGNDSPAVLVEGTTLANRAVNIPEFVNRPYDTFGAIEVPATEYVEHFNRGNALSRQGRFDAALSAFETALGDGPEEWRINEWRIHDSMSKTLLKMGKKEEAMEHIRASLAIWPKNAEMQANLGYLLFEQGNLAEARVHLDLALRLAPGDPQAWTNRGSLRLSQGDREGAEGDFGEAIARSPGYGPAWRGRGMVRLMRGDAKGAEADLGEAVRLLPDDPAAWYFRARARATLGNKVGARSDLDRAGALLPPGSPQRKDLDALRRELD